MKPQIGITDKHLHKSVEVLSVLLADEMTLYVKTRKFHWNVYGESFMELHKLFQAQYTQLEETIDEIAERINKLGGHAIGTMKEFVELTRIEEKENQYPAQKEMIKYLLKDHETITTEIRKDIEEHLSKNKDAGTLDFLTGIMEQHETTAWILRRYLK
ncbi:MAG: DNA starvation/stationary phase protection protein [Bacteroidetes bacterium]|nr:DNA starvation/stationary phase protection protein [Bacteroidota bacterium]